MSKPVAVIDVGSNSIKLLVAANGNGENRIETLFSETIETRISAGISKDLPSLTETGMREGCRTIVHLVDTARRYDPQRLLIVATSAVRDALNGGDFIDRVFEQTGIHINILSGIKEATYIGQGIICDPSLAGAEDFIQMDIGGGSLELIRFTGGQIQQALSLRLGAVRLTERFISDRDGPVSKHAEIAIDAFVRAELSQSEFKFAPKKHPLVATGGAFVVSRAMLANQAGKTIEEQNPILELEELETLKDQLCPLSLHERLSIPHLPASRADIIPAALITILAVLKNSGRSSVTHSFFNLRYGVARELLQ